MLTLASGIAIGVMYKKYEKDIFKTMNKISKKIDD